MEQAYNEPAYCLCYHPAQTVSRITASPGVLVASGRLTIVDLNSSTAMCVWASAFSPPPEEYHTIHVHRALPRSFHLR